MTDDNHRAAGGPSFFELLAMVVRRNIASARQVWDDAGASQGPEDEAPASRFSYETTDRDGHRSGGYQIISAQVVLGAALLSLDLLIVSAYRRETALALLRSSGSVAVLSGTFVNVLASLSPLFAALCLIMLLFSDRRPHYRTLFVVFLVASLFITPRELIIELVNLPSKQDSDINQGQLLSTSLLLSLLGMFFLGPPFINELSEARVKARGNRASWDEFDRHLDEPTTDESGENPFGFRALLHDYWRVVALYFFVVACLFTILLIATAAWLEAKGQTERLGPAVSLQANEFRTSMTRLWLSPEIISTVDSSGAASELVGYVLEIDEAGRWVTVVVESDRTTVVLEVSRVRNRQACTLSAADSRPLISFFYPQTNSSAPVCPSVQ